MPWRTPQGKTVWSAASGHFGECFVAGLNHVAYSTLKIADCQTVLYGYFQEVVDGVEGGDDEDFVGFDDATAAFDGFGFRECRC